jgi:hypothetical protein
MVSEVSTVALGVVWATTEGTDAANAATKRVNNAVVLALARERFSAHTCAADNVLRTLQNRGILLKKGAKIRVITGIVYREGRWAGKRTPRFE